MVFGPVFLGRLRCLRCRFLRRFLLLPGAGLQRWRFFPNSAVFALVLGLSVLFKEFFALELVFLGCTCGVAFSFRMPLLHLGHRLR